MNYQQKLDTFLVEVFHTILRAEEKSLSTKGRGDLSIKESHTIEVVCKAVEEGTNTASEIARVLGITPGSLTTAVNVLVRKGYLTKQKDAQDARRVRISPTALGLKANEQHHLFHREMVVHALDNVSEEEAAVLTDALEKLARFFKQKDSKKEIDS